MRRRGEKNQRQRQDRHRSARWLTWQHGLFFALGILVASGASSLFPFLSRGTGCERSHTQPHTTTRPSWGQLECTTIKLERPAESFPDVIPDPEPFRWHFENYSDQALVELIQNCDFTSEQRALLLDKSRWQTVSNCVVLSPTFELVRDMSLSARKQIYGVMKKCLLNSYMQDPFRFKPDELEPWLADSGLSLEHQELFRKVLLREGKWFYFYDGLLFEWICREPVPRVRMGQALTRTDTMLMKLRITPETDIDSLLDYWGQAGRGKAMRPLLEALAEIPGGSTMNVSYFFPTFARMRLFTYPDVRKDPSYARQDCTWTSINFFSEDPKPAFLRPEEVTAKLHREFFEVSSPWNFGDLLIFQNTNQISVHVCVYVADDVVFTKNGKSAMAPWVLMKRAEILEEYSEHEPLTLRVFRRKGSV